MKCQYVNKNIFFMQNQYFACQLMNVLWCYSYKIATFAKKSRQAVQSCSTSSCFYGSSQSMQTKSSCFLQKKILELPQGTVLVQFWKSAFSTNSF